MGYLDELNKKHKHPEWYPLPPGVTMAGAAGLIAILFVVYAVVNDDWLWGITAFFLSAYAIFEVGSAAYTAGLRREGRAQSLRSTRTGISASGAGTRQEDEEAPEE